MSHGLTFVQVAAGSDAGMALAAGMGRTLSAANAAATTSAKRALQPSKVSVSRPYAMFHDDETQCMS